LAVSSSLWGVDFCPVISNGVYTNSPSLVSG
jgi:hypothetical protein